MNAQIIGSAHQRLGNAAKPGGQAGGNTRRTGCSALFCPAGNAAGAGSRGICIGEVEVEVGMLMMVDGTDIVLVEYSKANGPDVYE